MANFPLSVSDIGDLCDWLELSALEAADGNASTGDLERELNRLGVGNPDDTLIQVIGEAKRRAKASLEAYPFTVTGSVVQLRSNFQISPVPYLFCLNVSYKGWKNKRGVTTNPWLLFEHLSLLAAKTYMGDEGIIFGTSSRSGRQAKGVFQRATDALSLSLREGVGYKKLSGVSVKDGKVDIVVWKPFPDKRGSQLIMFGQCAAGADWQGKLGQLQPLQAFWNNWMIESPVSEPIIKSFFMPHTITDENVWKVRARAGGILFDRCRVSLFAAKCTDSNSRNVLDSLKEACQEHWQTALPG